MNCVTVSGSAPVSPFCGRKVKLPMIAMVACLCAVEPAQGDVNHRRSCPAAQQSIQDEFQATNTKSGVAAVDDRAARLG